METRAGGNDSTGITPDTALKPREMMCFTGQVVAADWNAPSRRDLDQKKVQILAARSPDFQRAIFAQINRENVYKRTDTGTDNV
jgi:hypothetical protein